jgi:hypothetical protein
MCRLAAVVYNLLDFTSLDDLMDWLEGAETGSNDESALQTT